MNYGQRGRELLLELKRSDWLPPYNEEEVRATLHEISMHFDELLDQVSAARQVQQRMSSRNEDEEEKESEQKKSPNSESQARVLMEARPAMVLHDASIKRNKRCLLAYHNYRINKLRQLRKETSNNVFPSHLRRILSEAEIDFWTQHDRILSEYSERIELDLSSDLNPPEDNFLEVRVLQPGLGRIATENGGSVLLEVGTTHYLRRGDVEHLIRQGCLKQLNGEEIF